MFLEFFPTFGFEEKYFQLAITQKLLLRLLLKDAGDIGWFAWRANDAPATICKLRFVSLGPSRIATQLSGVSWRTFTNLALKSTPWEAKTRLSVWITSLAWHPSRRWRPASWQTDALAKNISPTPKRRLTLWWSNCWRRTTRTSTISSATSCWTSSSAMTPTN